MAIKIKNNPSPNILMNSMRSIGYSFETALADILDNSISANARNIYINSPINDNELFISILDDGDGMDDNELFNAMKYGSLNKDYSSTSLGRFGLGLKSASLSQCRILTVISKKNNKYSGYCWNLDIVEESKQWECLKLDIDEIKKIYNYSNLEKIQHGTMVVWSNFDIAYKKNGGLIREYLCDEMEKAELHIRLVFHRFLNNKYNKINIYINNNKLIGLDPFLENHNKTDTQQVSERNINGSIIKVQPYILPHQEDLTSDDIEKLGGIEYLNKGQGFYIYRNERLILYGTWLNISSNKISSELFKYGRIKVDIPNTLDDTWEIDVKKQHASVPKEIKQSLQSIVRNVCEKSKGKITKRVRLTLEPNDNKIWNKRLTNENKEQFYINCDSKFVKTFLDEFNDKEKKIILHFLDIISSTLPFDDIYNSICNKNHDNNLNDEFIESLVNIAIIQYQNLKQKTQLSKEKILDLICKYEPFNDEKLRKRIEEVFINDF